MKENPPKRRRVGLIYDERMRGHKKTHHPENPQRIRAVWDKLNRSDLLKRCVVLTAEDNQLALVHSKEHVDFIKTISSKNRGTMRKRAREFDSIYFSKGSSKAAYLAAGSVIKAAEKVAEGEVDSAFAIVRPPGHHAEEAEPMGFCLYNNVAIAASFLLNERPELGMRKILIVDWDVHHGNSTQKMFYQDPRVLFFSVHRHELGKFYPHSDDGSYDMIGEGEGAGYNINVPWENGMCGDADYFAVWDHILLPVAEEFDPDMIIISAGFDAAIGDPIGGCCVSSNGFAIMLDKLMSFASSKIVMALEGGYNPDQLANSVQACIEVLLEDQPLVSSLEDRPMESTWLVIQAVRETLSKYWPVLSPNLPDYVIPCKIEVDIGAGRGLEEVSLPENILVIDNFFDHDSRTEYGDESSNDGPNQDRTMNWSPEIARESSNNSERSEHDLSAEDEEHFNQVQLRYNKWLTRRNSRSWELVDWVEWHEEEDWVFEFTQATSVVEAMDTAKFRDMLSRKRREFIRNTKESGLKGKEATFEREDDMEYGQPYKNAYQEQDSPEVSPTMNPRKRAQDFPSDTLPYRKVGRVLSSHRMYPLEDFEAFRDTTESSLSRDKMMSKEDIKCSMKHSVEEFEADLNRSLSKMQSLFFTAHVEGVQHEVRAARLEAKEKISRDEVEYLRKKNKRFKVKRDRAEKALDHEIATGDKFLESEFGKDWLKKAKSDAVDEFKKSEAFLNDLLNAVSHLHSESIKLFCQRFYSSGGSRGDV